MTIYVQTQSGSLYEFEQRGDKVVFRKDLGLRVCGEVVKLYEELHVGGIVHVDYIGENIYCQPNTSLSYLKSTTITDITVKW